MSGVPEALRLADALQAVEEGWTVADKCCAELRRLHAENERLAALVEAQQPVMANQQGAPEAPKVRTADYEAGWKDGYKQGAWAAQQPSPTPQADSQPAPETDPVACEEDHPTNRYLFKHMCAVICIELGKDRVADALKKFAEFRAARAPADSVTAPARPTDAQIDACARSMLYQPWGIGSRIEDARAFAKRILSKFAPTPPAQAADSVQEDAARYRWLRDCTIAQRNRLEHYSGPALDVAIDSARKQGGA